MDISTAIKVSSYCEEIFYFLPLRYFQKMNVALEKLPIFAILFLPIA